MFLSARLKLTLCYVLIAIIIASFFSIVVYYAFNVELEHGLHNQRIVIQRHYPGIGTLPIIVQKEDPSLFQEIRNRFLERLFLIDLLIISISAISGYFMSGRTLRPIKTMVDEQNRFISDASHELRTPLTAARTSIEVGLRDKTITLSQTKDLLQSSLEDIQTMQLLADKLLLLQQTENRTIKNHYKEFSLKKLAIQAQEKLSSLAKEKQITFTLIGKDIKMHGNKDKILELFVILYDNAMKYSKIKTTVITTLEQKESDVYIEVKDQGVGIDEKDLPHIFDRFYRAEKSRTRTNTSGYGLGLSIAKKIIEDHNGSISVTSTVGSGTIFLMKLPSKDN